MAGSVALVAVVGVGATLAYFTDTDSETNVVTMGHVDIDLDEPIFSAEHEGNTISHVTPNQVITKDPTITVADGSEDCYLRVKMDVEGLEDDAVQQLYSGININGAEWVLSEDGYLYYQNMVEAGNEIEVFDTVVIPESWGNDFVNKTFEINITAEAIQADNFTPATNELGEINGWNDSEGQPITVETYSAE